MSKTNELELIKGQIQQVNKQGEYLFKIVDEVKETRDEINKIVGAYVNMLEDFMILKQWIKRLSNERNEQFNNRTITYAEFLKGKTRY